MARVLKGSHSLFTCTPPRTSANGMNLPLPSQPKLVLSWYWYSDVTHECDRQTDGQTRSAYAALDHVAQTKNYILIRN